MTMYDDFDDDEEEEDDDGDDDDNAQKMTGDLRGTDIEKKNARNFTSIYLDNIIPNGTMQEPCEIKGCSFHAVALHVSKSITSFKLLFYTTAAHAGWTQLHWRWYVCDFLKTYRTVHTWSRSPLAVCPVVSQTGGLPSYKTCWSGWSRALTPPWSTTRSYQRGRIFWSSVTWRMRCSRRHSVLAKGCQMTWWKARPQGLSQRAECCITPWFRPFIYYTSWFWLFSHDQWEFENPIVEVRASTPFCPHPSPPMALGNTSNDMRKYKLSKFDYSGLLTSHPRSN